MHKDRYGRTVAVSHIPGAIDIGRAMLRREWALAYRRYSTDYVNAKDHAKMNRLGIWRGKFRPPWEWRKSK